VKDRISGLKDKIDIKEKTEFLDNKLKSYKRNMQEFCDSIKRANLLIIGTKEEEIQAKVIHNIFNRTNLGCNTNMHGNNTKNLLI
jgi:hypothetical protein